MLNKKRVSSLCFTLFLLFFSFLGNASDIANTDIDQLLESANKVRTSNPTLFSNILNRLNAQQEEMTSEQEYYFTYLKAYKLTYNGKTQQSIPIFQHLVSSDTESLIKFRARITLINAFGIEQNWAEGLSHLSIVLTKLPEMQDHDERINGLTIAAIFYNQIGQYALGLKYATLVTNSTPNKRTNCFSTAMIIESKLHLEQLQNSESEIQQAIKLCKDEAILVNFIRSYSAKFNLTNNNSTDVIRLLTPHLAEVNSTKYPRLIVEIYTSLAEAYWLQGNLDKTEELALESIKIGENIKTTQAVISAYQLLYKIAKKRSTHQEIALKYFETYAELDKAYTNEVQAKHLAFQLAEHQAIEQENKIDLLNKKNDLLTSEKALLTAEQALIKANAENTRFIILILLMTLSVLLFWGYRLLKAHKRIKQLAEYDALTRIFNRGHFTQVANNAIDYCENANQELSIIMFDLDYFKKVNDSYGHACGDWALKKAVEVCQTIGRQNDIFARLGGEEFCLLLTSCNINAAQLRAEACRKAIAEINTADSGFDFTITASFGITDAKTSGYELEKLLADADSATYASKDIGRNQVTIFQAKNTEEKAAEKIVYLDDSQDAF